MKIVFLYPTSKDGIDFLKRNLPDDIKIFTRIRGEDYGDVPPNQDPEIIKECKRREAYFGRCIDIYKIAAEK